jgi:predicted nucleotidyltransferase
MSFLNPHLYQINELCKQFHVKELYAFGSVLKSDLFNEESDIDLLIDFKDIPLADYGDNYFQFLFSLEELFKKKVDLVSMKYLQNKFFIAEVEKNRVQLFAD